MLVLVVICFHTTNGAIKTQVNESTYVDPRTGFSFHTTNGAIKTKILVQKYQDEISKVSIPQMVRLRRI